MPYRFYYDDGGELTSDDEGCLVQLCERCARRHAADVRWAGDGAECCEVCGGAEEEAEDA